MIGDALEEIGWFWIAAALVVLGALVLAPHIVELNVWFTPEWPREMVIRLFAMLSRVLMQH